MQTLSFAALHRDGELFRNIVTLIERGGCKVQPTTKRGVLEAIDVTVSQSVLGYFPVEGCHTMCLWLGGGEPVTALQLAKTLEEVNSGVLRWDSSEQCRVRTEVYARVFPLTEVVCC